MIHLKAISENDLSSFYAWISDPETIQYSLSLFSEMKNKNQIDSWFNSLVNDTENVNLGIYISQADTEEHKFIGYAGICNISQTNKSGEYFIFIGDKNYWNQGIGTQVSMMIQKIAFCVHNLNRLMLTVSEPNHGAIKAYQKAGFTQEGILRQACLRKGQYHNKIIMSILQGEYINKNSSDFF